MNGGQEIAREFVIARGDGPEMLELIEKSLDEISLAVEGEVALALDDAVGLGRNDRCDSPRLQKLDQGVCVISLVAEEGLRIDFIEHRLGLAEIGGLSGRQR